MSELTTSAWERAAAAARRRFGRRVQPLDYTRPPGAVASDEAPPDAAERPIDVIVPIHGAAAEAAACLDSIRRWTDLGRHRLIVVADGDPRFDPAALLRVASEAPAGDAAVALRHDRRRGFAAGVNHALELSRRDVVLLNSDTLVSRGWLDKLRRAADSDPAVGTVTPFSNNATICSLPRPLVANELPAGWDVDRFAELVESAAAPAYPRLPTGVGFCLYLKRALLDAVGGLDANAFGLGYGEETELCCRALAAGFVHVLDDATFVYHAGERSFGASRRRRVAAAERRLDRLHPFYRSTLVRFLAEDPLLPARQRVAAALAAVNEDERAKPARTTETAPRRRPRVLHLVHGFPPHAHGGTELYAYWLARRQARTRRTAVFARRSAPRRGFAETDDDLTAVGAGELRVRWVVNDFTARNPLERNALYSRRLEREWTRFVGEVRPDLVHVHHLAGHALSLISQWRQRNLPLVFQVQDWWLPCARANLFDARGELCSGPSPGRCSRCLPLTRIPPAALWNHVLYRYRRRLARRALSGADAYLMGSHFIAESYRAAGLIGQASRVHVLDYGVDLPAAPPVRAAPASLPLRCAYVGAILPHKGVDVAVRAIAALPVGQATLEVWGDPTISPPYSAELEHLAGDASVTFRGPFAEADKTDIFAAMDLLLVPSVGLESYGLAAREAIAHGVPVLASHRGALAELFPGLAADAPLADGRGGAPFRAGDAGHLAERLAELAADPARLDAWRRDPPPVTGTNEHSEAVEAIYDEVLARRAR